jgi:hypothetical protein
VTEWQAADDRNNRDKVNRARQAAEDLFKPTQRSAASDLPPAAPTTAAPTTAAPTEEQPRRQPRIFAVPPRVTADAKPNTSATDKLVRRAAASNRDSATVPPAQAGRVRALTSYGMTRAQVAELYGVSVDEIERIIKGPVYSGRPR